MALEAAGEPNDFVAAFDTLSAWLQTLESSLSAREKVVLQLGLRLSHVEEAVAAGEFARARDHWTHVVQLADKLRTM